MRIADMNWMQVAEYLSRDDRAVVPLGSIEQHAYLSLATDAILAERVATETATMAAPTRNPTHRWWRSGASRSRRRGRSSAPSEIGERA